MTADGDSDDARMLRQDLQSGSAQWESCMDASLGNTSTSACGFEPQCFTLGAQVENVPICLPREAAAASIVVRAWLQRRLPGESHPDRIAGRTQVTISGGGGSPDEPGEPGGLTVVLGGGLGNQLLQSFGAMAYALDNGLGRTPPMEWRSWRL